MTNTARKLSTRALAKLNAEKDLHEKAFELVTPQRRGADWKDRISEYLSLADIVRHDVTLTQIQASIVFFTATAPKVFPICSGDAVHCENGQAVGVDVADESERGPLVGYLFLAPGYRAGPAGDG